MWIRLSKEYIEWIKCINSIDRRNANGVNKSL